MKLPAAEPVAQPRNSSLPATAEDKTIYDRIAANYAAPVAQQPEAPTLEDGMRRELDDVEQTLGRALGYPRYCDDQKNFPGATDVDGVCVGDHVAGSIAAEAAARIESDAERIRVLEAERDSAIAHVERVLVKGAEARQASRERERALQNALRALIEAASLQADASDVYLDTFGWAMNEATAVLALAAPE